MTETEVAQPPQNLDAERGLLGSILFLNEAIEEIAQSVDAKHFFADAHCKIYVAIRDMYRRGCRGIDGITLSEELVRLGQLEEIGGTRYVAQILEDVPHAAHVRYYARIVLEKYQRRQLIRQLGLLLSEAWRPDSNIEHVLQHTTGLLQESSLELAGDGPRRTFGGKSAAELWELADQLVEWIVEGVFSCDQPTIFGAKQKSLKTTLLTDLVVSLTSGLAWLGRFKVPKKRRVLFITGEASEQAAIRKVRKAALSRNLRREDLGDWLRIEAMTFPNLPSLADCKAVETAVKEHGTEVVVVDPLYMGLQGLNTTNLNEVGPAMRQFMAHCRPANLIIAHHVKKTASYDDAPNLEDLSQAGIAEFAGNYWLMGRLGEYTGDGLHDLAIRYGGRDEQFGMLKLEFDECKWTSAFTDLMAHRADNKARKENERASKHLDAIKNCLRRHSGQASLAKLAEAAGTKVNRDFFQRLIDELCDAGHYERCQLKGGNNKPCEGLKVKGQISKDTVL